MRGVAGNANLIRVTITCFLAYAILSGLLSQIGTLSAAMSDFFTKPLTETSARFSWLSLGITVGSVLSIIVYEWLPIKKVFLLCYLFFILALIGSSLFNLWQWLPISFFIAGCSASLGLNTAAVTLSLLFKERQRAAILLSTDICFASAGILAAPGAAALLRSGFSWNSSFLVLAAIAAFVMLLALFSRYPPTARELKTQKTPDKWHFSIYFCCFGLAMYLLGQIAMLIWLPNYIEHSLMGTRGQGAAAISAYWTGMALGQITLVFFLIRFTAQQLLILITIASFVASIALWQLSSLINVVSITLLLGLCNAGVLKLTMSFSASLVSHPQRVITTLLFCSSLGQMASPLVSSTIVTMFDIQSGLQFVTVCYLFAASSIIFAVFKVPNHMTLFKKEN